MTKTGMGAKTGKESESGPLVNKGSQRELMQSPKKVGDDIAKATGDWKGLRITVKLTIQNRQAQVPNAKRDGPVVPAPGAIALRLLQPPAKVPAGSTQPFILPRWIK
ncbi:hypothetical protein llap_20866 [Limosa lapponica baueri]|uniref:Large ribosomal subunit protein uL11 N-terminal domain-containing protein n=1 Tax=Limosa lapponica baueri TaxID=1758121 RepID=A0A2I0T4W1_LIMLA|nr:hypothetical protein llap_20866 [Limosa lapponica baueri]